MLSIDEKTIRASFINASRKEATDIVFPTGFAGHDWDRLDYLGWSDPKMPKRAYIVVALADGPVGIVLKQADAEAARDERIAVLRARASDFARGMLSDG